MKTNNWKQLLETILVRKVAFAMAFFFAFLITFAILAWLDFLPEAPTNEDGVALVIAPVLAIEELEKTPEEEVVMEKVTILPETVTFDTLNKTITIANPESREVAVLDEALLHGAVRHPDSATLDRNGTVFVLGHSSYLPVVVNKNFQAFNGIQDLKWGDTVRLTAGGEEYVYRVYKVYRAKASDTSVPIVSDKKRLVLATCNSFGSTDDRYIVEAEFVSAESVVAVNI